MEEPRSEVGATSAATSSVEHPAAERNATQEALHSILKTLSSSSLFQSTGDPSSKHSKIRRIRTYEE
jgi:hypothetical protein